jgi:hypothetical protein
MNSTSNANHDFLCIIDVTDKCCVMMGYIWKDYYLEGYELEYEKSKNKKNNEIFLYIDIHTYISPNIIFTGESENQKRMATTDVSSHP